MADFVYEGEVQVDATQAVTAATVLERLNATMERLDATILTLERGVVGLIASLDVTGPVTRSTQALNSMDEALHRVARSERELAKFQAFGVGGAKRYESNAEYDLRQHDEWTRLTERHARNERRHEERQAETLAHLAPAGPKRYESNDDHETRLEADFNKSRARDELRASRAVRRREEHEGTYYATGHDGPRRYESRTEFAERTSTPSGGGHGGGRQGVSGAYGDGPIGSILRGAAWLYTIERLARGIGRLAEIIERSAERNEEQNSVLRELGVAEPQIEARHGEVAERAKALNVSENDFFEVFTKATKIKAAPNQDPTGILHTEMDLAAGAYAMAGGGKRRADLILSEFGRATQTGNFNAMRNLPGGGAKGFLEAHGYSSAQTKLMLDTKNHPENIQPLINTLEELFTVIGNTRLPDSLPREISKIEDAFDHLIRGNKFPYLSEAFDHLADLMEHSEGFALILRMLDFTLDLVVSTVNLLVIALDPFARALRDLELNLHLGPPPTKEERADRSSWLHAASSFTALTGVAAPVPIILNLLANRDDKAQRASATQNVIQDRVRGAEALPRGPAPAHTDTSQAVHSAPHAMLDVGGIQIHVHQQPGENPEELARRVSAATPTALAMFVEHMRGMSTGLSS